MAQCKRCGQKVGLFASYCDTCSSLNKQESLQRQAEERERDAEIRRALEEAAKERMRQEELAHQQKIEESIRAVRERVTAGQRAFLHQSLYLSVNSVILGEETAADFDIDMLRQLGLAGWDVVAVVPRTMGIALENKSVDPFGPVSYGGGVGGNVVGVYIIIRKEVTPALDSDEPGCLSSLSLFSCSVSFLLVLPPVHPSSNDSLEPPGRPTAPAHPGLCPGRPAAHFRR